MLRGEISVENKTLDDFILVKSDGLALYHLAAMVDDHRMAVTHVIRGSEWLSTLPLHALVVRAFGWREPAWCHLSIFLKPSGKGKMSKRDTAQAMTEGHSIYVRDLKEMGYIPEGIAQLDRADGRLVRRGRGRLHAGGDGQAVRCQTSESLRRRRSTSRRRTTSTGRTSAGCRSTTWPRG